MKNPMNVPYDFSNPQELKDALLHAAEAYVEYSRCWAKSENLLEDFDETLENSDFPSWLLMSAGPEGVDKLTYDAAAALRAASDLVSLVMDRAQANLAVVLRAILAATPEVQMTVWGAAYNNSEKERDDLLGELFDAFAEEGHADSDEEALPAFLSLLHSILERQG